MFHQLDLLVPTELLSQSIKSNNHNHKAPSLAVINNTFSNQQTNTRQTLLLLTDCVRESERISFQFVANQEGENHSRHTDAHCAIPRIGRFEWWADKQLCPSVKPHLGQTIACSPPFTSSLWSSSVPLWIDERKRKKKRDGTRLFWSVNPRVCCLNRWLDKLVGFKSVKVWPIQIFIARLGRLSKQEYSAWEIKNTYKRDATRMERIWIIN